jgi:hypothetical protein
MITCLYKYKNHRGITEMPHKHKSVEFEQLLVSIASGECVDTKLELDDYGLDDADVARLEAAKIAAEQRSPTKPNNNNFPQDYLNIIRNNSARQSTQPKPRQLFSFNDAIKELRRTKKTEQKQAENDTQRQFSLDLS